MNSCGKVYLVGAGPGDPGLITVRGLACIQAADVLVYDKLVAPALVAKARPDAELVYVGKESSRHTLTQEEINDLLVDRARQGKVVTRLKGGDPFVFGRGGEEAARLRAAGIPFEIVPGVTSAIAVPAYAGIPVTHRGIASSFAVITGHEDPSKEVSSLHWEGLATGVDTLVFLMGVENLAAIVDHLIVHGRSPATPAALISHGATPRQTTVVASLATIAAKARQADLRPPAVLVVGDVVTLRPTLAWFDTRPLMGVRVLVTRAGHQAHQMSDLLAEQGASPIELPTIEIQPPSDIGPLDEALRKLDTYDWIVFTSVNGVEQFFARLAQNALARLAASPDADDVLEPAQPVTDPENTARVKLFGADASSPRVVAIGPATGDALRRHGLKPDFTPGEYTASAIAEGLARRGIGGQRVLLARAEEVPELLASALRALAAVVDEVAVYRTVVPASVDESALEQVTSGAVDVITFTSSSTVRHLIALLGGRVDLINRATVACIGPITAATAQQLGVNVAIIAEEHTVPGLVRALVRHYHKED